MSRFDYEEEIVLAIEHLNNALVYCFNREEDEIVQQCFDRLNGIDRGVYENVKATQPLEICAKRRKIEEKEPKEEII